MLQLSSEHICAVSSSSPCGVVQIAHNTAEHERPQKTPRDFDRADALVQRCLDLIDYLKPRLWFVENPDSGLLKTRSVINHLPYVRLDYCMYGSLYRKRTRIWTNAVWKPKLCDRSRLVDNKHLKTAQRGGRGTWNSHDTFDRDQLHALPNALCDEIVEICNPNRIL